MCRTLISKVQSTDFRRAFDKAEREGLTLVLETPLVDLTLFGGASYTAQSLHAIGQVAQLVERGPEKAGVGGSIPSLATISFNDLASLKTRLRISRVQYAYIYFSIFTFGVARSIDFRVSQPVLPALVMCCRTSLSSALSS